MQICFSHQNTNNDNDYANNGSVAVCLKSQTDSHAIQLKITLTGMALDANFTENNYKNKKNRPRVRLNGNALTDCATETSVAVICTMFIKFNSAGEILTCVRFLLHYRVLVEKT